MELSDVGVQLGNQPVLINLEIVAARDQADIVQEPSSANDFLTIIEFNDNLSGGPSWYEIIATFGSLPEPEDLEERVQFLESGGIIDWARSNATDTD